MFRFAQSYAVGADIIRPRSLHKYLDPHVNSTAKLPIVMRAADIKKLGERAKRISSIEERAADLFSLALPSIMPCGAEYTDEISVI